MSEIRVHTESGSIYILNQKELTWDRERMRPDGFSLFPVRTKGGKLNSFPEKINIGEPLVLLGPPLTPGTTVRMIETSPIVKVES